MTRHRPARVPPRPRALRTASGVLAGGLVALAVALGVVWFVATRTGEPGPDPGLLFWHGVAALAAVGAQVRADRAADRGGSVAAVLVLGISVAVLLALWLS